MGLFSNNKKVCPLCGNPTPRLLALKVEDTPLCKECERKIDLPQGAVNEMIQKTSTTYAPWHILESVDKKYARIKALRVVIAELEKVLD